ncbi:MAG: hypothetical protein SCL54_14640 [Bacillota bacterium]|nr:hypothetical protein [Bacillota bacterium]
MDHIESIELGLADKKSYSEIARKVFLTYPTKVLIGNEEKQYSILNEISQHFSIPIMSIHVVGSAKMGCSFHKDKIFTQGESDLDIAIIDAYLFQRYVEMVFKVTKGYSEKTLFDRCDGISKEREYLAYLNKGDSTAKSH